MSTEPAIGRLLDEELARSAKALSFRAKNVVASMSSGLHRSTHHGTSMVFAEHREYRPGDDPRQLDWRAYARSDRPVIRRFEQEARVQATLVLDRSPSMAWRGFATAGESKADHAATLLASFAYLLAAQGDALAFRSLAGKDALRPSTRRTHLMAVLSQLVGPLTESSTSLAEELTHVAETAPPKSVVLIASDLLQGVEEDSLPWALLAGRGRQIMVVHTLHADEVNPRFEGPARFVGLEDEGEVEADFARVGDAYHQALGAYCERLAEQCAHAGVLYLRSTTDTPAPEALAELLRRSSRR